MVMSHIMLDVINPRCARAVRVTVVVSGFSVLITSLFTMLNRATNQHI